jgi:hypothetical protein
MSKYNIEIIGNMIKCNISARKPSLTGIESVWVNISDIEYIWDNDTADYSEIFLKSTKETVFIWNVSPLQLLEVLEARNDQN